MAHIARLTCIYVPLKRPTTGPAGRTAGVSGEGWGRKARSAAPETGPQQAHSCSRVLCLIRGNRGRSRVCFTLRLICSGAVSSADGFSDARPCAIGTYAPERAWTTGLAFAPSYIGLTMCSTRCTPTAVAGPEEISILWCEDLPRSIIARGRENGRDGAVFVPR